MNHKLDKYVRYVNIVNVVSHLQWRIQDFPEEGAPIPQGGCQHTNLPNFPMKLNEFGLPRGGGHASLAPPLDAPLHLLVVAGGKGGGVMEYCANQNATPLHGRLLGTDLSVCSYDSKFARKLRSSQLLHFAKIFVSRHLFHYIVTGREGLIRTRLIRSST